MLHAEGFKGLLLFLIAAGIFIPLFHRARIGPVLGFLLVGYTTFMSRKHKFADVI